MRTPTPRDLVIQRYAPALLAEHYGVPLPVGILSLDTAEANIIAQIATQFRPTAAVAGDPALAEAAECIARHYDSSVRNHYWQQQLDAAYSAAEADNSTGLRLGSDRTPIPAATPSANPGPAAAPSPTDTSDDAIADAKSASQQGFDLQKQRLLLLLANKRKDLAFAATADEEATLKKLRGIEKGGALTEHDVEFYTAGLVQHNLAKDPAYYDENYETKIKAAQNADEAWTKLRRKWNPKDGGTAYKGEDFKTKGKVREGFRMFLATLLAPLGYARAIYDLYKTRAEGNRTKGNAALLGFMVFGAMVPFMILSMGLMPAALPIMGVIAGGLLKLAALMLGAAALANPVGAIIVLALIALAVITVAGVLAYRAYQASAAKPSLQSIDPQVQSLYQKNGYSVEQVKKAIADLADRKKLLEGMQPSDRVKEELAKVNRQLEALRGNPTGMMVAISGRASNTADERFEVAKQALAEYAKEHAGTMGVSADTFFQSADARKAAEARPSGYSFTSAATPAAAPASGGAGAMPAAPATAAASSFDPDAFARGHGHAAGGGATAPTMRGP